jgi:DNA modification methylase
MSKSNRNEAAAVWVPITALKAWANNPRKNDQAVAKVAQSIQRFGFGAPLLARKADGVLIAGHTRLKAATKLGLDKVPVRYLDLDPAEAHLLALADNKTAELAEWDEEVLGAVLADLKEQSVDLLEGTGFTDREVEQLIESLKDSAHVEEEEGVDPSEAEELQAKWQVQAGQRWRIPSATVKGGEHRLLCGDSRDAAQVRRLFGGEKAGWMWTDPPYGVDYKGKTKDALTIQNDGADGLEALLRQSFAAADAVLVDGAPIYVCHPTGPLSLVFGGEFVRVGWRFHQTLVWVKNTLVLGHADYQQSHEGLLYGWKGKNRRWFGGRTQVSVIKLDRPTRSALHPTMKPLGLIEATLKNSSARGDLGYEPFAGSGSTLLAAEQLQRLCFGVELEPKYAAVVLERLARAGLQPALME